MDLQGENRIFVKAGLRALHKTQNLGLQELIRVQGIEAENVTPYHIASFSARASTHRDGLTRRSIR